MSPDLDPDRDPLDRAADALRRAPTPDGPSEELVARTLAALRGADDRPGRPRRVNPFRRPTLISTLKFAAAALVAVGTLSYVARPRVASATAPLEAASRKLKEARTLSFRLAMEIEGQPRAVASRISFKAPNRARVEAESADKTVSVMDMDRGTILVLQPGPRSAFRLDPPPGPAPADGPPRDLTASMIDDLRRLPEGGSKPVGERAVGGRLAKGFQLKEDDQDLTVWVDPDAGLPLLIEVKGKALGKPFRGEFSEIRLDPPLDDALFRLDVPEGYTLVKLPATLIGSPEAAVARMLRIYAEANGGAFPPRLDDMDAFVKAINARRPKDPDLAQAFEVGSAMARLAGFIHEFKGKYIYSSEGVKLGDAGEVVFRYTPEGQARAKAVFGDLRVGEVDADKLPAPAKP